MAPSTAALAINFPSHINSSIDWTLFIIPDYFLGECYSVCLRRLQVLIESSMYIPAFNLTSFLVRHVMEDYGIKRPKWPFLHHDWLQKDKDRAHVLLDLHMALLFKRKEESSHLQYLVRKNKTENFSLRPLGKSVIGKIF